MATFPLGQRPFPTTPLAAALQAEPWPFHSLDRMLSEMEVAFGLAEQVVKRSRDTDDADK
jgi:hypothetical protein